MPDDKMLSQEEIDALLNTTEQDEQEGQERDVHHEDLNESPRIIDAPLQEAVSSTISSEDKDALGEIGNISMGSAATTLSELLRQRVTITSPKVRVLPQSEFFNAFDVPLMIIEVEFKEGLKGHNILIMQLKDARLMASLMMGGDGTEISGEISELEKSAASEAMNQMIGTASTSLANMFNRSINISPPKTNIFKFEQLKNYRLPIDDPIVVVSFRMTVGNLMDTEIMQILSIETAREETTLLWQSVYGMAGSDLVEKESPKVIPEPEQPDSTLEQMLKPSNKEVKTQEFPGYNLFEEMTRPEVNQERLATLMDIPLRVTVVMGRTQKPIKEVLGYTPGAILELSSQINEPVEILVNGVLVALGEVVVANENFGVRVTDIITPAERVQKLTE